MNYEHFIEIDSEWGRIGNLHWANSVTTPIRSAMTGELVIFWGCFVPHVPIPGVRYTEWETLKDQDS